ncbi:TonB-dependent receptor [Zavarzinia compransoris]|uniref:TonB-dependent receptor n=1 Tax=Zavarzinia compransoris TaxID=1264899 RepID=A0A317EEP6_9PROT|nr:TonB-dependent receptor [Zavarzinia compransoris]PWR23843.1 hypothetical protein DKG75_04600 [Zavarzinia compransoris]TDP48079.1 iron complex outermembrane receptor protein [Zavarzinia compransoris]
MAVGSTALVFGAAHGLAETADPADSAAAALSAAAPVIVIELDPVEVTARRRPEMAADVPLPVSVVSGETLKARATDSAGQFYTQIPNAQVFTPSYRNASFSIRGLGNSLATEGLESAVGVFVDGVYRARPGALTATLFDLDRIEVMRGPQGTTFGRNTSAGALSITTAPPDFEPGGWLRLSYGHYDYGQVQAVVTGPVSDTVALRLSSTYTRRDGFVENTNPASRAARDLNDYNDLSLRGQVLWVPDDRFSLRLIVDHSEQDGDCCVQLLSHAITTQPDGSPFPNGYAERLARVGYDPGPLDSSRRESSVDAPQTSQMSEDGIAAEVQWEIGDHLLTAITAWRRWRFEPHFDGDYNATDAVRQFGTSVDQQQFSQEIRLASRGGETIDTLVGAYYFRQDSESLQTIELGADAGPTLANFTGIAPIDRLLLYPEASRLFDGFTDHQAASPRTESLAGFGQATWNIDQRFALTAGLRYTADWREGDFRAWQSGGGSILGLGIEALDDLARQSFFKPGAFSERTWQDNLSGLFSAGWHLTESVLAYALVATGYKAGGINFASVSDGVSRRVAPEKTTSYELGLKAGLFDQRLQVNTALYWTIVDDYQSSLVDRTTFTTYLGNVGRLRARGIEVEVEAIPLDGLRLTGSVSYNDTKILSYADAPCPPEQAVAAGRLCTADLAGRRLRAAPLWTAFVSADYARPLGTWAGNALIGFIGASYAYRSSYNTDPSSRETIVPAFGLADARLGLGSADERWRASLWVRNLFDENYFTAAAGLPYNVGAVVVVPGDPRTFGLTVEYRF